MFNEGLASNTYDRLKNVTQVWLPASGSLYFGLAQIWGFPAGEEIVGSIALLTTFFGVILKVSSARYESSGAAFDGTMSVEMPALGKKTYALELDGDPEDLSQKDRVVFRVVENVPAEFEGFYDPDH
jgi:hypothetical protein